MEQNNGTVRLYDGCGGSCPARMELNQKTRGRGSARGGRGLEEDVRMGRGAAGGAGAVLVLGDERVCAAERGDGGAAAALCAGKHAAARAAEHAQRDACARQQLGQPAQRQDGDGRSGHAVRGGARARGIRAGRRRLDAAERRPGAMPQRQRRAAVLRGAQQRRAGPGGRGGEHHLDESRRQRPQGAAGGRAGGERGQPGLVGHAEGEPHAVHWRARPDAVGRLPLFHRKERKRGGQDLLQPL